MTQVRSPLGRRIRAARALVGLDQADLAERLGVHRNSVSSWETGTTEPRVSEFVAIAALTGQSLEWLAEGVVRPKGLEPPTFCSVAGHERCAWVNTFGWRCTRHAGHAGEHSPGALNVLERESLGLAA